MVSSEEQSGNPTDERDSIREVLTRLVCDPRGQLLRRWNWKSTILSASTRSVLFFFANLGAGADAARGAFLTELMFRGTTAGFYGALTQAFRRAHPPWTGTVTAMVLLPLTTHFLEYAVHRLRGTPHLAASIAASVAFTSLSTAFNLFAMRRGTFIVGADSHSLWKDLRSIPAIVIAFIVAGASAARAAISTASRFLRL